LGGAQHVIPVTYAGKPYLIVPSELGEQGVHFIDISDETHPSIVADLKLQIQLPENRALYTKDGAGDGFFVYDSHYCEVDRTDNPTALACGYFQSGIRVFNIVDPSNISEIAYFNPPAQMGKAAQLPGSEHAAGWYKLPPLSPFLMLPPTPADEMSVNSMTEVYQNAGTPALGNSAHSKVTADLYADWCSSPPRFVDDQLWVTCQDNGFMVLTFTNGVYPIQ
jgi:hypothetical protein